MLLARRRELHAEAARAVERRSVQRPEESYELMAYHRSRSLDAEAAVRYLLLAGDKAVAMRYLNDTAKAKFGPVFDVLMPFMAEIVGSYSPLARSSITGDISEYAVKRTEGGVPQLYLIYFLRGADGIWRIDEM